MRRLVGGWKGINNDKPPCPKLVPMKAFQYKWVTEDMFVLPFGVEKHAEVKKRFAFS